MMPSENKTDRPPLAVPLEKGETLETVNDGLTVIRDPRHLLFGTDALLLAGYLNKGIRAAELGAGTGAVSLLAAARGKFARVDGVELQRDAVSVFERNVALNGLDARVFPLCADLRALPSSFTGRYDCVFSNPPYMKTNAGKPCASPARDAARHETAGDVFDFAACAARLLSTGGDAVFVYRPDRLVDLLDALRSSGIEPKRITFAANDPGGAPSAVLVRAKKGAAPGAFVTPAFFIKTPDGTFTDDYLYLLRKGAFPDRYVKP